MQYNAKCNMTMIYPSMHLVYLKFMRNMKCMQGAVG